MNAEKNDVDVRRLFSWGTAFELSNPDTEEITMVYMRLVGDEDMNKARVYALRESKKLRETLRDTSTDESIALIPSFNDIPNKDIVEMVAMFSTRAMSKRAIRDVSMPLPKEPKDSATLEEHEEYQNKLDMYEGELELARIKYVRNAIDDKYFLLKFQKQNTVMIMFANVNIVATSSECSYKSQKAIQNISRTFH